MKEGWKMVKFEDAIQKVTYTNKISSNSYKTNGCYPIVSQEKDLINGYWNNEDDLFKVQKPIIIFGDHTKVVKYIDFDFVLGADGVKILLPHDGIDSKFFYYYVSGIDLRDLGYARHYKLLKEKNIPLPPLEEQHRIVGILDAAFAKIDALKANAEANLTNAKALFQQVLAQELKPKEGWVEKKLEEVISNNEVGLVKNLKEQSPNLRYPYLKMGNITNSNYLDMSNMVNVNATQEEVDRYSLHYGDFLFNTRNSKELVGKTCVYNRRNSICLYNNNILRLLFTKDIDSFFVNYLFGTQIIKEQLDKIKKGTTNVWAIYYKNLKDILISYPSLDQQKTIVSTLDTLSEKCRRLEQVAQQTIRECDALKQSILRQAFSGEL